MTDKSRVSLLYEDPDLSHGVKLPVWTTLVQGDMDQGGELFSEVIETVDSYAEEVNTVYKTYNPDRAGFGTHLKLLLVAALITDGDILEMGSGDFSTRVLHDIVKMSDVDRELVTAESNKEWLTNHKDMQTSFHKLIHILQPGSSVS